MAVTFYKLGDFYHYHSDNFKEHLHPSRIDIHEMDDGRIRFTLDLVGRSKAMDAQEHFSPIEVLDRTGVPYGSTVDEVIKGANIGMDVNVSDQTTPSIVIHLNKTLQQTELTVAGVRGEYTVTVASATNAAIQRYVILHDQATARYMAAHIVGINGNILSLDRPLDFSFPIGTHIDYCLTNMNVNGSVTPQIFGVRGVESGAHLNVTIDVTRIVILMTTTGAVTLAKFGDITTLLRGVHVRRRDGDYTSLFSFKNNGELAGLAYDWTPYAAANPNQGQNGFVCRLTFAGQEKMGVVQRLGPGEDLEFIVQDDLRSILEFEVTAQGHVVQEY